MLCLKATAFNHEKWQVKLLCTVLVSCKPWLFVTATSKRLILLLCWDHNTRGTRTCFVVNNYVVLTAHLCGACSSALLKHLSSYAALDQCQSRWIHCVQRDGRNFSLIRAMHKSDVLHFAHKYYSQTSAGIAMLTGSYQQNKLL